MTFVLVAGAVVVGLVLTELVPDCLVSLEDFSIVGGSCGGSFEAMVLQARANTTHGRAIAKPNRKRWSAINQWLERYSDMFKGFTLRIEWGTCLLLLLGRKERIEKLRG